jgi:poly(A) polymerase
MPQPRIVAREAHTLSRTQIDPDALKVLYRLHHNHYTAYLVGGSVRDLLLGRRPKDFDIGTSAHPYQVKRLFRNCWIIGRRFRLAHVRFGTKTIEVATFRRQVAPPETAPAGAGERDGGSTPTEGEGPAARLVHRDNTFGTAEEDAFRRDFTVNALFYDIGTRAVIDYTGGLDDLRAGLVRSIGDPDERFLEDPVRMLRAVALAARLGFDIDPPVERAIAAHRGEIARSAPARLMEEFYKLLRSGAAERSFRMLAERRLLEPIASDLQRAAGERLWLSLAALDAYRARHAVPPDTLTNAVLLGSLLAPLGYPGQTRRRPGAAAPANGSRPQLGMLPLSRRDVERFHQIVGLERRLLDRSLGVRARRALSHRSAFPEALTWLDVHGQTREVVDDWRDFMTEADTSKREGEAVSRRRRRRRRRRGPHRPPGG